MTAWSDNAAAASTRRSLAASFAEKYALLLLNTGGTMVLARLLTPAEVGLYAVGAVVAGLAQVLRDFGVGAWVVQEKQLTADKLRAALGVSLLVGWSLAAIVYGAAWPVAAFYGEPQLQPVLQLLAINFVLLPFSALAMPCLRRALRFGAILFINLSQTCVQLGCAIWLAWRGFGHLSLVWAAVAGTATVVLATLACRPRHLPWLPGWRGTARVWRFGAVATGGTVIDEAGVAAPDLIVGKLIGVAGVGLFGKAVGVVNVFNQLVTAAISPVIFPLFSAQARHGADLRQAYLATVSYMAALAWPFFGAVALLAPAIVRGLYGPQWAAAAPLVRTLCLASAVYSLFSMARYLFVAMGEVGGQARLDATAVPVRIAALLLAAPFGLAWVAWAVVAGAVFRSWLTYRLLNRLVGVHWRQLGAACRKSAAIAGASLAGPGAVVAWADGTALQLAAGGGSAVLGWLLAVLLVRHDLADECRLAGRRARSWLAPTSGSR
ncbi:MAG: lipopolysaccharide biosynthesis protein [Duganella sp.]